MAVAHHPHCAALARGGRRVGVSTAAFTALIGWPQRLRQMNEHGPLVGEIAPHSRADLRALVECLQREPRRHMLHLALRLTAHGVGVADVRPLLHMHGTPTAFIVPASSHPDAWARWRSLGERLVIDAGMPDPPAIAASGIIARLEAAFADAPKARMCVALPRDLPVAHALLDAYPGRVAQVSLSGIAPDGMDDAGAPRAHRPLRVADIGRYAEVLDRCADAPWIIDALGPSGHLLDRSPA